MHNTYIKTIKIIIHKNISNINNKHIVITNHLFISNRINA